MATTATKVENTIEAKLRALYDLQKIDSQIDKIKQVRGELPLEVQDLEDELEGLRTRLVKLKEEVKEMDKNISDRKNAKEESKALIKKYEDLIKIVKFNREDRVVNEFNLTDCVICMDKFENGDNVRQLPSCRHIFHPDCIIKWLKAP